MASLLALKRSSNLFMTAIASQAIYALTHLRIKESVARAVQGVAGLELIFYICHRI
jgi:hypothetical protein